MTAKRPWDLVLLFVTLAVSLAFGVFLGLKHVTDPFLYYDTAFIRSLQDQAQLVIPKAGPYATLSFVTGREMLMLQFANMMGIDPQTLQFLPIGTVLVALALYFLGLRLLKSPVLACLLTLYLTLNLSHSSALYSVFAYSLAIPLFIAFIVISVRFFESRSPREVLLLLLLFIGTHLIHYTITTWLVLFLLGANLTIWLQKRLATSAQAVVLKLNPAHYLFLTTSIIFLWFNDAVYKSFFPLISPETLDSAVQRFMSYLSFSHNESRSPYLYSRAGLPSLISTITLGIIMLPVAIGVGVDLWQLLVRRSPKWLADPQLPVIFGLVLLGLVDSGSYAIRGSISTKAFSILFPVLTLLYFLRFNRRFLALGMAGVLVLTSLVKIGVFYSGSYVIGPQETNSSYQDVQPSAAWLRAHVAQPKYSLLADLNLYGKYLLASVHTPDLPLVQTMTDDRFAQVVGKATQPWSEPPVVVAIDKQSVEPTVGFVWQIYAPIWDYASEIRQNKHLNLVYDDGAIVFAMPNKAE